MKSKPQIIFATANPHKVREISRINNSISFLSLLDVNIHEDIPETCDTFKANARQKADYVYQRTGIPTLSEDSGLVISSLDGAPGVLSARYAGDDKNHDANIEKVLRELKDRDERHAYFISTICFIDINGQDSYFVGKCNGHIHTNIEGSGGFGYDPIFIPDGYKDTFGTLSDKIKDEVSHRKKSFAKFASFLLNSNQY